MQNCLFVKAKKYVFHTQTISFLRFVVKIRHIRAAPEKVKAVAFGSQKLGL